MAAAKCAWVFAASFDAEAILLRLEMP